MDLLHTFHHRILRERHENIRRGAKHNYATVMFVSCNHWTQLLACKSLNTALCPSAVIPHNGPLIIGNTPVHQCFTLQDSQSPQIAHNTGL